MDLQAIKDSRYIYEVVWTYNLCSGQTLSQEQWSGGEAILHKLLAQLIDAKTALTEAKFKAYLVQTVAALETLWQSAPLDQFGVYEYGGLNYFFADLAKALGFPVQYGVNFIISNLVYGEDFSAE